MNNIITKMKEEIIKRSNEFQNKTKGTKDEYNLYNEHIQYVFKYVNILSKNKIVDLEVLQISALLHDISMTDISLDRSKHNEYGTSIAEELLINNNYPKEKIELVKKCIYNHSNKRKEYRTTIEEQILVDADSLSHFDNILSLYSLAHNEMNLNELDSIKFIQDKLTKDYNEITNETKIIIKEKYDKIMNIESYEQLKEI